MIGDWAAVSAIAAVAGFGIAFATFWITFGGRITRAETDAAAAMAQIKDLNDRHAVQVAASAMFREKVAADYIHREAMREVEDRLTQAIDRIGERFDRFVEAAFQNRP